MRHATASSGRRALLALVLSVLVALAAAEASACLRITNIDLLAREITVLNMGTSPTEGIHWLFSQNKNTAFDAWLSPGESVVVTVSVLSQNNSSMSLHSTPLFQSPTGLLDFVQWGGTRQEREAVAVLVGTWEQGTFVPVPPSRVLQWQGSSCSDSGAPYWVGAVPTETWGWGGVKALFDAR